MNRLKLISIAGLLLAFMCIGSLNAIYASTPPRRQTSATLTKSGLVGLIHTTYFDVHYDPSEKRIAKLMAEVAHEELLRISRNLGYTPGKSKPFPLYVYPSHYGFIKAGGLETSKFTVGTASSGDESLSVDTSGAFAKPEKILAHEITHVVIFRILQSKVAALPLWFNEGLAKYESDDYTSDDDQSIIDAAATGVLIPLSDFENSFPEDRVSLAYAESANAMQYMMEKYGKSSPKVILRELARTGSFDTAMQAATGRTSEQFMDDWYNKTTRKYWPVRISRTAMTVISVLMAILVIAAFLVRRKQKIEAARRWDQEEFEESMRKQLGNDWWR